MARDKIISNRLFNLYLDNLEISYNLMDSIIPIVWKFDNKVYNARFSNAITKRLEELEGQTGQRIWIDLDFNLSNFKLELHFTKRCLSYENGNAYLPSCYDYDRMYAHSKYSCYGNSKENENYHTEGMEGKEYYFYIDSNYNLRINAKNVVNILEEHKKYLRERIDKLKEEVKKVEEYETRVKELKDAMERLHEIIPYCFSDFFDLKTYATYN